MRHNIINFAIDGFLLFHGQKNLLSQAPMIKSLKAVVLPIRCRVILISALAISGCGSQFSESGSQGKQTKQESALAKPTHKEVGEASWYGPGFQGKETANGETFDTKDMTAAHPSLPMGTKAKVTNLENGKKVEVRINDRGPYVGNRAIDLSGAAAKKIDMKTNGTTQVKIEAKPTKK